MDKIKVVHYVNQFFGHIGGEDQAGIPPTVIDGPVGVGKAIQQESGHHFEVVKTIICGDNYAAEHVDELVSYVLNLVKQITPTSLWPDRPLLREDMGLPVVPFVKKLRPSFIFPLLQRCIL